MNIPESAKPYIERQRTLPKTPEKAVEGVIVEAQEIAQLLKDCRTILDIGCGVGILSTCLARYGFTVTGFDKTKEKAPSEYGWTDKGRFYNSLEVAAEFAAENDAQVDFVDEFPSQKFDAVISLYSWGFHYPVELYSPDAPIWILDFRKGKGNYPEGEISVISENHKAARIMVQR